MVPDPRKLLTTLGVLSLLITPRGGWAQDSSTRTEWEPARTTVTAGLGNTMGWFGGQFERRFADSKYSLLGGFGYSPDVPGYLNEPTGIAVAAGLRRYLGGRKHSAFLEMSVSQVGITATEATVPRPDRIEKGERNYGPGLSLGYQYVADGGFTFLSSAGVGYAVAESEPAMLVAFALGYTWRSADEKSP